MQYKPELLEKAKELYPDWTFLHEEIKKGHKTVEAHLEEGCDDYIPVEWIAEAKTLEDFINLKEKASLIVKQKELYKDFISGKFLNSKNKMEYYGCPRWYGMRRGLSDVIDRFGCTDFSYVFGCPNYGTEKCWNAFFAEGFAFE